MVEIVDPGAAMSTAISTSITTMMNTLVNLIVALIPVALIILIGYVIYRWVSSGKARKDVKAISR